MKATEINRELDHARDAGPVKDIVIPPCPQLLVQLQAELNQPDPDPLAVAAIAASDVAMTAALIRLANSPLYARREATTSVAQAVSMLGLKPTATLLTGFLLRHTIRIDPTLIEHFWESSTRRSMAMAHIARQLYGVDVEIAKTCGLFFHVGIPVMLQGVRGYSGTLVEAMARQDRTFIQTENAAHRTDHAVVGAIVARTWRLPQVISHAVRLHHDFAVLSDDSVALPVRQLVAIAAIADHLVAHHEGVREQREWLQHGAACLSFLQIGQDEVDTWVDTLYPAFESVVVA
ncbi:HDOD domain-containing protein [Rhodoferax sp.]|uniref:HDOD domain-containing protein n=1 Tax=Rhodoferax sp. TaxID=50421 RepID=UPI002618D790|nr:HDOD domain-containing protein [Rhodoferax sp.]MDD2810994.1 HDOD domain-containing protein [Rhodoferax sp.]MDD4944383.1 HDOD domain-containing protein [Rhodoferax sp.]MDD5480790.1 HDOD domain-containing protein [Rhodoferax sp.]